MKQLTLIVHTDVQQYMIDYLRANKGISGYTVSAVEGHGVHPESDAFLAARDRVVGHKPRLRIDILLENDELHAMLTDLGKKDVLGGECAYWVIDVERAGHL